MKHLSLGIYRSQLSYLVFDIRLEDNQFRHNLSDLNDFQMHVRGNYVKVGAGRCPIQSTFTGNIGTSHSRNIKQL